MIQVKVTKVDGQKVIGIVQNTQELGQTKGTTWDSVGYVWQCK